MLAYFFELLPVLLAMIAAVTCASRYSRERRRSDRVIMVLGVLCAVLLIFAQTSWWTSYVVQGHALGTQVANAAWTVFNCLVMVSFILSSLPRRPK